MRVVSRGGPTIPPLEANVIDANGQAIDASAVELEIVDPQGNLLSGFPVTLPVILRVGVGHYQYTWNVPADASLGEGYRANWTCVVNGLPEYGYEDVSIVEAGTIVFGAQYTYDVGTDIGRIRLNIDDRDLSAVSPSLPLEQRSAIFNDAEIAAVLEQCQGDILYASARLLIAEANSHSLLVLRRKIGRTEVDFGTLRADLLRQAQALVDLSNAQPAVGQAEIAYDDFSLRRIITNTQLRQDQP